MLLTLLLAPSESWTWTLTVLVASPSLKVTSKLPAPVANWTLAHLARLGIGGLLAGAAGAIFGMYNNSAYFLQGFRAGLYAFTAAVMGGIGNLKGAVVGGLIIGVIQSISDTHFSQVWTPAVVFAILILVMVFRPQGLFGEETREG